MIINHTYRFIFLHVPKTAGTSVTRWLSTLTGWNDIELGGTHYGEEIQAIYGRRFKLHKHSPAAQVRAIIGEPTWSAYYKFAVVRDPFDRLVSTYQFYREWEHPAVAPVKAMSNFEEFLYSDFFERDRHNATRPAGLQSSLLGLDSGMMLDDLCRFETLNADVARVADVIGVEPPVLERVNSSDRADTRSYYTAATRALTAELYAPDFALLDYPSDAE